MSAEGRRGGHLNSFTFRWSANTNAEGRIPNILNTWVWGTLPEQEEGSSGNKPSEISKRTDCNETLHHFLKLDVVRNSCWRDCRKKELCPDF